MAQKVKKHSKHFLSGFCSTLSTVISLMFFAITIAFGAVAEATRSKQRNKGSKCSCKFYPEGENERTRDKRYEYWKLRGRIYASPLTDMIEYPHLKTCKKCGGAL
ncbi:MAG: hypothetical protein Q7S53_04925 [bacterium]|nr:hypothetical protein [bacterium]